MPRTWIPPQSAIDEYNEGATFSFISKKYSVEFYAMKLGLLQAGVTFRRKGETLRMSGKKRWAAPSNLKEMYIAGRSVKSISTQHKISAAAVHAALDRLGIERRTRSQANYLRAAQMTPEMRRSNAYAANEKARGAIAAPRRARARSAALMALGKMTQREAAWAKAFAACGVLCVPQYAVDKYNIDLAVPLLKVAIEINCGWHYTGKKRAADEEKTRCLERLGWEVHSFVDANHGKTKFKNLVNRICELSAIYSQR